jgi:hypothetical protein
MLEEAFQAEWQRRLGQILNPGQVSQRVLLTSCFPVHQIPVKLTS